MKRLIVLMAICSFTFYLKGQTHDTPKDQIGQSSSGSIIGGANAQTNEEIVKDIDGNVYHTVTIGNQTWLKENLRTTHYRNGDKIPTTIPSTKDISNEKEAKYQWAYKNDESLVATSGRLYTMFVVSDERNICPVGWHIPSEKEWDTLVEYLGGIVVAGGKMKEKGTVHWAEPNKGATNESGFTALPAGGRDIDGTFSDYNRYCSWWYATPASSGACYTFILFDETNTFKTYIYQSKYFGFSVRCIKD
jgi:uncharacterized protein (TIGR02145 family)